MISTAWNVLEHSRVFSAHMSMCMVMVPAGKLSGDEAGVSLWVHVVDINQSQRATWREGSSKKSLKFKFELANILLVQASSSS